MLRIGRAPAHYSLIENLYSKDSQTASEKGVDRFGVYGPRLHFFSSISRPLHRQTASFPEEWKSQLNHLIVELAAISLPCLVRRLHMSSLICCLPTASHSS